MTRLPGEPYRQFYDRIVAFMSRHLMPKNAKQEHSVDGIQVPDNGDTLTVSMLNMLALRWLEKIHPDLLGIVRTEYSKELRDNTPLPTLVPRIALSIDALLAKYDKLPSVAPVSLDEQVHEQTVNGLVNKVNTGRTGFQPHTRGMGYARGNGQNRRKSLGSKQFCPGCYYLGNRMSATVNFKHSPQMCPRATSLVAMLEAEEIIDEECPGINFTKLDNITENDQEKVAPIKIWKSRQKEIVLCLVF